MATLRYQLCVFDDSALFRQDDAELPNDVLKYFSLDPEIAYLLSQGYHYQIVRLPVMSLTSMTYEIQFEVIDLDLTYVHLAFNLIRPEGITSKRQLH